jgi:hypothetical protein
VSDLINKPAALAAAAAPDGAGRLDAAVAWLTALRGLVAGAPPEPTAGNSPPAAPTVATRGTVPTGEPTEKHRALAALLTDGPLGRGVIGEKLGVPNGSLTALLSHPWFQKSGPGLRDPWMLSLAGREATGAGASTS